MEETINVFGMTCMHCHKRVTDAISKVNGVISVDVNLEDNNAIVEFDENITNIDAIKQAVVDAGYEVGQDTALQADTKGSAQSCPVIIDEEGTADEPAPMHEPDTCLLYTSPS